MNILIVIPAIGDLKGIYKKNLILLNNKSLIYYSAKIALSSTYKINIYVSSEII